jgi:hypothetical protein
MLLVKGGEINKRRCRNDSLRGSHDIEISTYVIFLQITILIEGETPQSDFVNCLWPVRVVEVETLIVIEMRRRPFRFMARCHQHVNDVRKAPRGYRILWALKVEFGV